MSKITRTVCDICEKDVDHNSATFVDAGVYGAHMHLHCLEAIGALRLIQVLGLDDITIGPDGEKLIYSRHVTLRK